MIKTDNTKGAVEMTGDIFELCDDVVNILNGFYKFVLDKTGEETANETIALIGRIALNGYDDEIMEKLFNCLYNNAFIKEKNGTNQ